MILTYHPKNQEVKKVLLKNFSILADDPRTKDIFPTTPMCVYRRDTNLQDILVHSTFSSHPEQEQDGTFPCQRPRCRTCTFTGRTANINHANGVVHAKERHTCTTISVIYAITCRGCQAMYIGETGHKLADRFGEHLRSVEGYHKYPRYQNSGFPVAEHFSQGSHNSISDMSVSMIKSVAGMAAKRRREEMRTIFIHKTLAPDGMNIDLKILNF